MQFDLHVKYMKLLFGNSLTKQNKFKKIAKTFPYFCGAPQTFTNI